MPFESWLWAQVSYDFNLEESHGVMGWLQLSQGCSAANHKAKQLEEASAMAQELGNKGERSFDCFGSRRTPGEQNPGETNNPPWKDRGQIFPSPSLCCCPAISSGVFSWVANPSICQICSRETNSRAEAAHRTPWGLGSRLSSLSDKCEEHQ